MNFNARTQKKVAKNKQLFSHSLTPFQATLSTHIDLLFNFEV
jgi:hypothetical protein